MSMLIYKPTKATSKEFVEFWMRLYEYPNEHLYNDNIGQQLTKQSILALFEWKNGSRLSNRKDVSVRANFINRRRELEQLGPNKTTEKLLAHFPNGGVIFRIFWLHCWQPTRFPIYDQHVYRAMKFIQTGRVEKIPKDNAPKIASYINEYMPFFATINARQARYTDRDVDKALWAFGKFLKKESNRRVFDLNQVDC